MKQVQIENHNQIMKQLIPRKKIWVTNLKIYFGNQIKRVQ